MKVISGHQPTYLPWLGLIHKAMLSDVYIYMDDVQYLTQDWNNRNAIKSAQGSKLWLTVPVDLKESKSNILKDVLIKDESNRPEKKRWYVQHFKSMQSSYGKTDYFKKYKPFFEDLYMNNNWTHLSELNLALLKQIFHWFKINSEIIIGSEQNFQKKKSDLVLEHGIRFDAEIVLTGMHGKDYIKTEDFKEKGIKVHFQDFKHPQYEQKFGEFLSHMSFVDLLFNVGEERAIEYIQESNLTKDELCKI